MKRRLLIVVGLILLLCLLPLSACSEKKEQEEEPFLYTFGILNPEDPIVELTLSNGDSIRLELFPWLAPETVENFLTYVRESFYDGVAFHRIIRGFMIQTGGFEERDGALNKKTPTHATIKGEFLQNGFTHPESDSVWAQWAAYYNIYLSHTPGVISMARIANSYNSASSEFFICSADSSGLNGGYAAFGRVIDMQSMDAVLRLGKVKTHDEEVYYGAEINPAEDVPVQRVFITSAREVQIEVPESTLSPSEVPWFTFSY